METMLATMSEQLGPMLVILGAALAVGFAGSGSAWGIGLANEAAAGIMTEDPKKFGYALVLLALPGTQGIYGLLVAVLALATFCGRAVLERMPIWLMGAALWAVPWPMHSTKSSGWRWGGKCCSNTSAARSTSASVAKSGAPREKCRPVSLAMFMHCFCSVSYSLPGIMLSDCTATWVKLSRCRRVRAFATESTSILLLARRLRARGEV